MKEILEISAAIVGLLTALIPLIGRFLDMRKRAARQARHNQYVDRAPRPIHAFVAPLRPSIAIMPGACVCCLAGMPVGIWAFVILLRPEVSAAFT
jgi:hypothetical protein